MNTQGFDVDAAFPMLAYFRWGHLPEGRARGIAEAYAHLARETVSYVLHDPVFAMPAIQAGSAQAAIFNRLTAECAVALRKLLEAKDAAVRACLP